MSTTSERTQPKQILKTLTILYYAFIAAPLLLSLVILMMIKNYTVFEKSEFQTFYYAIPFLAIGLIYVGLTIFKTQISHIKSDLSLNKKLSQYQSATIIKSALLEGPALLCVVLTLISEQLVFIIIAWCILVFMYIMRPTKERVINDLKLNSKERSQLN